MSTEQDRPHAALVSRLEELPAVTGYQQETVRLAIEALAASPAGASTETLYRRCECQKGRIAIDACAICGGRGYVQAAGASERRVTREQVEALAAKEDGISPYSFGRAQAYRDVLDLFDPEVKP